MATELISAESNGHIEDVRKLFREYADQVGVDLCFQGFDRELAELPGMYDRPDGRLILALHESVPAGCVGVRPMEPGLCEMKRLYVRPAYRGLGIGRKLARAAVRAGRSIGYERMRLDTLSWMSPAIGLYESLGFRRIDPYYDNPLDGAVYLECDLTAAE